MSARPYVIGIVAVAGGLVGIRELADATLTTHVRMPADSRTVVVVHGSAVDEAEFSLADGMEGLVRVCQLEVGRRLGPDALEAVDEHRFRFEITPGLDDADEDQFSGCIGDIRIDHLQASVASMTLVNGP